MFSTIGWLSGMRLAPKMHFKGPCDAGFCILTNTTIATSAMEEFEGRRRSTDTFNLEEEEEVDKTLGAKEYTPERSESRRPSQNCPNYGSESDEED
jgi:hypothetical protein